MALRLFYWFCYAWTDLALQIARSAPWPNKPYIAELLQERNQWLSLWQKERIQQ